jgi:hypothetical protein
MVPPEEMLDWRRHILVPLPGPCGILQRSLEAYYATPQWQQHKTRYDEEQQLLLSERQRVKRGQPHSPGTRSPEAPGSGSGSWSGPGRDGRRVAVGQFGIALMAQMLNTGIEEYHCNPLGETAGDSNGGSGSRSDGGDSDVGGSSGGGSSWIAGTAEQMAALHVLDEAAQPPDSMGEREDARMDAADRQATATAEALIRALRRD